jgi:hypothetical protein
MKLFKSSVLSRLFCIQLNSVANGTVLRDNPRRISTQLSFGSVIVRLFVLGKLNINLHGKLLQIHKCNTVCKGIITPQTLRLLPVASLRQQTSKHFQPRPVHFIKPILNFTIHINDRHHLSFYCDRNHNLTHTIAITSDMTREFFYIGYELGLLG